MWRQNDLSTSVLHSVYSHVIEGRLHSCFFLFFPLFTLMSFVFLKILLFVLTHISDDDRVSIFNQFKHRKVDNIVGTRIDRTNDKEIMDGKPSGI